MTRWWTLERLGLEVRDRAARVDDLAVPQGLGLRRDTYLRYLCDLYGVVLAVEASFAFTHALEIDFIDPRIQSGRIAADVLALGLTPTAYGRLARRCPVPPFDAPLVGLGWIYALERLGPAHDRLRGELAPDLPASFLAARATGPQRWAELGAKIDHATRSEADFQALLGAATAALTCLESWFEPVVSSRVHVEPQARSA